MMTTLAIPLPEFLVRANSTATCLPELEARMRFVLGLVRANMAEQGGPFAAAVFERDSGRLVAAGVNRVVSGHCSAAHAEVLALSLAQQRLQTFDLSHPGLPALELVSSAEPCLMCLGAVLWSGVRQVVCGARSEDVAAIGFDEGPKPLNWQGELDSRGIRLTKDVLRAEAVSLLTAYDEAGGLIYNAGKAAKPR